MNSKGILLLNLLQSVLAKLLKSYENGNRRQPKKWKSDYRPGFALIAYRYFPKAEVDPGKHLTFTFQVALSRVVATRRRVPEGEAVGTIPTSDKIVYGRYIGYLPDQLVIILWGIIFCPRVFDFIKSPLQ